MHTTVKHYSRADLLAAAEPIGTGWSRTTIDLAAGETAYSGTSKHWQLVGPGQVTYLTHPAGWRITADPTVTRRNT